MDEVDGTEVLYARLLPRVQALLIDVAIYVFLTVALVIGTSAVSSDLMIRLALGGFTAFLVLYEPIMVWRYGGTIGHSLRNLRVVSDGTGGNPSLLMSFTRWFVKGFFGVFSFLSMGLTRRHQALHGAASRTTVQVRDLGEAREGDFVGAREAPVGAADVGAIRRLAVILGYQVLIFVVVSVVPIFFLSDACALNDVCTEGEELAWSGLSIAWLIVAGLTVVLGWRGRLIGARSQAS